MPKLKPSETDQKNDLLRAMIAFGRISLGLGKTDAMALMRATGLCKTSAYSRLAHPEDLTLGDLRRLRRTLNVTPEEFAKVL